MFEKIFAAQTQHARPAKLRCQPHDVSQWLESSDGRSTAHQINHPTQLGIGQNLRQLV
jgi:hypothetical protein